MLTTLQMTKDDKMPFDGGWVSESLFILVEARAFHYVSNFELKLRIRNRLLDHIVRPVLDPILGSLGRWG